MDIAGAITTYIISGIVSFASIFNPAIGEKISQKPTPQVAHPAEKTTIEQYPPISTITPEELVIEKTDRMKSPSATSKNNANRKLNVAMIPKGQQIQIGVPILPLKEIFSTTTVNFAQRTQKASRAQEKNIFDIINTIPTLVSDAPKPSSSPLIRVQNSIGNIFCKTQNGNNISVVTGSAVVVNSLGVAITNAHVAQYPLIEKYFKNNQGKTMNCIGRIGSPASGNYKIDVLYISPNWIKKNARNIIDPNFSETGEDDLAIIRFVPSTNRTFSHTNISDNNLRSSSQVYIGSYPAIELREKGLSASLYGRYEQNLIREIDYYVPTKPIFETEPSSLGQAGSSGGGVFDSAGNLTGIIALIIQSANENGPHIRGLTISHINKTLSESGTSLDHFITGNPDVIENNFSNTAAELETILMQQLSSSR